MLHDFLLALISAANRVDVNVSRSLPIVETTTRQLLAQEALVKWDGPFSITDFAEALGCSRPAARQTVERLLESERVTIERYERDGRYKSVRITENGRALMSEEWACAEAEVVAALLDLTEPEIQSLVRMLQKVSRRALIAWRQR